MKEITHWILAFVPIGAATLSTIFRTDNHTIELICIISAVMFNFIFLGLRSFLEKDNELSLFYTFRTDRVKPPKKSGELLYNTKVSIVEDGINAYFREKMYQKFLTELDEDLIRTLIKDKTKLDEIRIDDEEEKLILTLLPAVCKSLEILTYDPEEQEREENNLKNSLKNLLSDSEAVIAVRSEELENKIWAVQAINEWAIKNSEAPVVFVRPKKRKNYPKNKIIDNFFWIKDNPKSIPWALLKRSKDRATVWRKQASYNRAMVTNITFLLLMCLWILGVYIFSSKNKQIQLVKGIKIATETKDQYEEEILKGKDTGLNVSYWFTKDNKPYVFVTTERGHKMDSFEKDTTSIIGCVFSNPSKIARWDNKTGVAKDDKTGVFESKGNEWNDSSCNMRDRTETITSLVCSSYKPSGSINDEETVGICIFTGSNNSINIENSYTFLKKRTEAFYNEFADSIKKKAVTALADRIQENGSPDF